MFDYVNSLTSAWKNISAPRAKWNDRLSFRGLSRPFKARMDDLFVRIPKQSDGSKCDHVRLAKKWVRLFARRSKNESNTTRNLRRQQRNKGGRIPLLLVFHQHLIIPLIKSILLNQPVERGKVRQAHHPANYYTSRYDKPLPFHPHR